MEKRLLIFLPLAFAIIYVALMLEANRRAPNQPLVKPDVAAKKDAGKAPGDKAAPDKAAGDKAAPDKGPNVERAEANPAKDGNGNVKNPAGGAPALKPGEEDKAIPEQRFWLGSVKQNPYEMGITITSMGAAVERIELADPRYRDIDPDHRFGYLGHLALVRDKELNGCRVNVVGEGTPAAEAGLKIGDVIVELKEQKTPTPDALLDALKSTEPGQTVAINVRREGAIQKLSATLGRRPLEVIRPEIDTDAIEPFAGLKHDPLSFLLTLHEADDDAIVDAEDIDGEIQGLHLRTRNWEGKQVDKDTVEFSVTLPKWDLKIVKRYRLARLSTDKPDQPAYHLMLQVEISNTGDKAHTVAYQLDGATGLPTEGWWYASRIYPDWGAVALRDIAVQLQGNSIALINSMPVAQQEFNASEAKKAGKEPPKRDESVLKLSKENDQQPLFFAGVDAQYFSAVLMPQHKGTYSPWLADIRPIIVGEVPTEAALRKKVDVTCRLTSVVKTIEPKGMFQHEYQVFVGPKLPELLVQYHAPDNNGENLSGLVYYGYFWWVSQPMVAVLEIFHAIVRNYGLAIILLTVLVRLCMFPLSRKQALSAKKMQELQPEMKKINEKFKSNPTEKTRATQELWRKHNYNPLGGCLLVFVQLPIFMGLYRSLMVNVQLRGASLLGDAVRWCSNLASPDLMWNWGGVMPSMLASPTGWLGPYLNILPLFTVGLFIWQQSMFMPPATDDNTAMQQKIMKYMTLFMGVMFFKVAAGLCIYFIASSLWGIGERKLLPRLTGTAQLPTAGAPVPRSAPSPGENGNSSAKRKKQRGRR